MIKNWEFNIYDEILANELKNFIPKEVLDIHFHPYRLKDLNLCENFVIKNGPENADMNEVRRCMNKFFGDNKFIGGLILGYPTAACDIDAVNNYVLEQVDRESESKGSICISPNYPISKVLHYLENPKIIGLKPYHVFSNQKPTFDSTISGFLPEWAWEIADERGLIITLHMVKDLAIADPLNQKEIQMMCTKYPNAKLVLAHAARCFHAPNARKGLKSLHGLENVWFDMAAICEVEPIIEIISEFGSKKLMWGSDFPVCMIRGRAVTLGMNFIWLQNDTIRWDLNTNCNPVLVGLESLRALETAVYETSLKNEDVKNIFFNNAADLLGIGKTNNKILQ